MALMNTFSRNIVHGPENEDAVHSRNPDSMNSRQKNEACLNPATPEDNDIDPEDSDTMDLYTRVRSQKEEIQSLREQIANTCVRELQLRNEKYALERKFADLRMAVDERQNEAVTSALNELVRRKVDLEENLKLTHELKVVEAERYVFVSSMLALLDEYGVWPHAVNASALSYGVKQLHDQLQWKIRTSNDRIRALTTDGRNQAESESYRDDNRSNDILMNQISPEPMNLGPSSNVPRNTHDTDLTDKTSLRDGRISQQTHNPDSEEFSFIHDRQGSENTKTLFHPSGTDSAVTSSSYEEGPAIEDFQIIGNATPGEKLLGCGYPVRGTSLCMFQWIRHLGDGTRLYIEGATNPEYVVTADDVDKLIAVECIPMDDQGRQGELMKLFANDQNKIKCDPEMQQEIDMYISVGEAAFSVLLLTDSSDAWEATTLFLRHSGYQIKSKSKDTVYIADKFSKDFSIKIPSGLSTQVVLACSDGSSHPLSASTVRMRDILVLTMRLFHSMALDEKRKTSVLSRT